MNVDNQLEKLKVLLVKAKTERAKRVIAQLNEISNSKNDRVTHVTSTDEACDCLKKDNYSVVFLDLSLPNNSALDLISVIQKTSPAIPIIVLSTWENEALCYTAIQKGAQDYLIKGEISKPLLSRAIFHSLERKRQLQSLALQIDNLQAFARAASHDLKAPLGNIKMISEIVIEEAGNQMESSVREMLHSLPSIAGRLKKLIDDLLEFSMLGHKGLHREQISLDKVLNSVCQLLELQIRDQNATIDFDHLDNVYADSDLMATVFQNLIGNSCKYVKDHAPVIRISTKNEDQFVVVMVEDNGIGIPEKEQQRIFNPLVRAVNTCDYEGTGLGLAMVKKIIEAHQGKVWVESSGNKGSTFFFTLPKPIPQTHHKPQGQFEMNHTRLLD